MVHARPRLKRMTLTCGRDNRVLYFRCWLPRARDDPEKEYIALGLLLRLTLSNLRRKRLERRYINFGHALAAHLIAWSVRPFLMDKKIHTHVGC